MKFTTINDEMISMLEEKTKEMISEEVETLKLNLLECVSDCESPIERMLALSLNILCDNRKISQLARKIDIIGIHKQEIVKCGSKKYRVDFLLPVIYEKTNTNHLFIIECDGYEFHEKTKEQVTRDKERERDLIKSGNTVIRFSGSEIYKNPFKCAKEVIDIIFNYQEKEGE